MKLTPVLYVDAVEPCLPFWTALGFIPVIEVPEGDRLGFVMLAAGAVEVMYQSRANLGHDIPAFAAQTFGPAVLYLEVEDLDAVERGLAPESVIVPRRLTSYGADEIWVREPGGHVVGLARHARA
jgi:hypothetical protein